MKPGIVIVNTARGAIMDEDALVEALNKGTVASVGLDVFENEPKIHPGLMDNEKVLLLPHLGTWTVETQAAMERVVVKNVRSVLLEKRLVTRVGEQAELPYED
jgi:glyoxylate reductase